MTAVHDSVTTTIVVGIGAMAVTGDANAQIVTYALGSCLGISAFDPIARVGGLLHVMLPSAVACVDEGTQRPERYIDTGVPNLFRSLYQLGAVKQRLVVKIAGGAASTDEDTFEIGKRNILALRRLFWKNGVLIQAQDTGGTRISRTMGLDVGSGEVWLRVGMERRPL
jgi:chemotaxis protein CheD